MRKYLLLFGLLCMIVLEVLKVYFIMPFPGSQKQESIEIAYFLHNYIVYFRLGGISIIVILLLLSVKTLNLQWKAGLGLVVLLWAIVFYMFNFRFMADKMFYQPKSIVFYDAIQNKVDQGKLVLGIEIGGEARAYPIEVIGYHHQVRDTVGRIPVLVTYCTVCRTGRAYSPTVNGKPEDFRLVGMDHFNAMFEDASTKSWWRQVSGQAIAGPLKGNVLDEIPTQQMSLRAWLNLYPTSTILQPDSAFLNKYERLEGFDTGVIESHLEYRDSLSWKDKSWVVGIEIGKHSRAYDWNELVRTRVINDTLGKLPVLIYLESDSVSFHTLLRDNRSFHLVNDVLTDKETNSSWNSAGACYDGELLGSQLDRVQAYQEFWHSWRTFHPRTTRYPN